MEAGQPVDIGVAGVVEGGVVAEHDHLDALQAHDPVGFGPAPVVADAHAHDAAESPPYAEAEIARLEIALLQMLVNAPRLRLGMAGQVHLAVLSDDLAVAVDDDGGVEAAPPAALVHQFGVADIEADAELLGLLEQRRRFRPRHLGLVIAVELGFVFDHPAREEGGEGKLGKDDQFGPPALGFAHHGHQPAHRLLARLRFGDRSHLRRCGFNDTRHVQSSSRKRLLSASKPEAGRGDNGRPARKIVSGQRQPRPSGCRAC